MMTHQYNLIQNPADCLQINTDSDTSLRLYAPGLLLSSTAHQARITNAVLCLLVHSNTLLSPECVQAKLSTIATNAPLAKAYQRAIQDIIESELDHHHTVIKSHAQVILQILESQFTQDTDVYARR